MDAPPFAAFNRNDLAYWFPLLAKRYQFPLPRTEIVQTGLPLLDLLDGRQVPEFSGFLIDLLAAADKVRYLHDPFFLRTGHTSGKHRWEDTCYVRSSQSIGDHVFNLVEESALAGVLGLPTETWAVRSLIRTSPVLRLSGYRNMPVSREFRLFVRDGLVEHAQPYWPPDAVEQGEPTEPHWRRRLAEISVYTADDRVQLEALARQAGTILGDYWSIDFLQDVDGVWWLTDCAEGDQSFKWDPGW